MARKGENIFKRKDGRWEGRFIKDRIGGRAVYGFVYGSSYLEAKNKKSAAITMLAEKEKNRSHGLEQPLFREVADQWLEEIRTTRKKSTIAKYRNQLDGRIIPALGDKRIDEIANNDLMTFINGLLSGNGGENLSPKSVADILSRLKSIRRFALIHGYEVAYMPDCMVIPQRPKDIRVLTFAEEKILLNHLKSDPSLIGLGILVCLFTGIRIGELCALTWNDVSLDERELHVRRTMQRLQDIDGSHDGKTYINIDEPKSRSSIRTIPIPDNIMDVLRRAYTPDAYLLTGKADKFIEPRAMEYKFKAVIKSCGIADINFHALRHTFATRCVEAGFDIKSLSEILGHANVNITLNRYVHPTMKLKRENMDKLSKYLQSNK